MSVSRVLVFCIVDCCARVIPTYRSSYIYLVITIHVSCHVVTCVHTGVDLLRAFVATVRRSAVRYAGQDSDPEVTYERMPNIHFAIDGKADPLFNVEILSYLVHRFVMWNVRCATSWFVN